MKNWLVVLLTALAFFLGPTDARAAMELTGDAADQKAFKDMLTACSAKSPSFKKWMADIEDVKHPTITVAVGRTGAILDSAGAGASTTVNLDNLERMPDVTPDGKGGFTMQEGHPPWALTRCELLLHFLRETYSAALAQMPGFTANAHKQGIIAQAEVRKDFKQKHTITAQTNSDKAKGPRYVDVVMDFYSEHLSFEEGKLVITYFHHTNELRYDAKTKKWEEYDHDKWKGVEFSMVTPLEGGPTFACSFAGGVPFGNYSEGNPMRDEFSFMLPVQVDAGYRFAMGLYIGGHFAIAPAFIPSKSCVGGASCSGSDTRIGVDARVHFLQEEPFHPWAGIGFGYEMAHTSLSSPTSSFTQTAKGFEFLQLQAGADYAIAPSISIGPFVQFGIGKYSSVSGTTQGVDFSSSIPNTGVHEWLTAGVRGEYTLRL